MIKSDLVLPQQLVETQFSRDPMGRILEKFSKPHQQEAVRTTFEYDAAGQLLKATNSNSQVNLHYDLRGLVSKEVVQANANLKGLALGAALQGRAHEYVLHHFYDELGTRISTELPDGRRLNSLVYGSGHVHQINLDGEVITDFERDNLHRELNRTQGALLTQSEYDPVGRLLSQRVKALTQQQDLSASVEPLVGGQRGVNTGSSSFGNNSSRPRLGASLAGVGSKSYFYDSLGQLTRQTDGWGSYQYQYDAVGQLLSSVSPLSQERFAFDPAHNLVPVGSNGPTTNQVGADPINQGASSQGLVDDFGRLTVYEDKRYTYDAHGRLLSKRIGKHTHLQLHWNAEHQLVQSQRLDPQTSTVLSTTHYRYDPFGRRMAKLTLNELGQESKAKLASTAASQANSQATLFVWDGNRILQEIESNGFEVVLPSNPTTEGVVKAIQVPASRTRLYVYEPDSFVPLAQVEWASPLQTFSLPPLASQEASNEKVLHDFAYFPYTTPSNATHWQVPGTNIVAPLPSFEQAQQQAVQVQQRQKASSQATGPRQWPDVLPLSSLTIKPAHPPVFKAEDVGLDEAYFNKAGEARAVDGERNNAPENALNDETNNTPSLAKVQAIMQQLQPEESALLAHMQASFNAVANKIKQASNDAKLNPFKEPTPPPQGSAKQVRIRYYHCDQLGTPKELTSNSGELVWYAQYKAWGNTVKVEWLQGPAGQEAGFEWGQVEGANSTGNSSSNDNSSRTIQTRQQTQAQVQPIRFQGQYYDWETGLHYNRFRYYDPDCGRFICKDPIGLAGGLNLFQYASNPVGWVDPFGLIKCTGVTKKGVDRVTADWRKTYGPSAIREHHLIPQEMLRNQAFVKQLQNNGVKDSKSYIDRQIAIIDNEKHCQIHKKGWNKDFKDWYTANPNFTQRELQAKLKSMMREYNVPASTRNFAGTYGTN